MAKAKFDIDDYEWRSIIANAPRGVDEILLKMTNPMPKLRRISTKLGVILHSFDPFNQILIFKRGIYLLISWELFTDFEGLRAWIEFKIPQKLADISGAQGRPAPRRQRLGAARARSADACISKRPTPERQP